MGSLSIQHSASEHRFKDHKQINNIEHTKCGGLQSQKTMKLSFSDSYNNSTNLNKIPMIRMKVLVMEERGSRSSLPRKRRRFISPLEIIRKLIIINCQN